MRSLAIVARKGGAGKSTLAIHLAIGGHLRDRFTLLADMDPQGSALEALGHRKSPGPLVRATTARKLFVCLEDARKAGIEDLVIDTAAGSDAERLEAIRLADASLIVVRPTYLDIVAAAPTVSAVRGLGKPAMILLNQAPPTLKGEERPDNARAIAALALFGLPVSSAIIRLRRSYQRAPNWGCLWKRVSMMKRRPKWATPARPSGPSVRRRAHHFPRARSVTVIWAFDGPRRLRIEWPAAEGRASARPMVLPQPPQRPRPQSVADWRRIRRA